MEKDIGKITKNDTTDIVVRIDDFGGNTGLTIREFVTSDRYTGFTKSGVRIHSKDFQKFKEMINSISEADLAQPEDSEGSDSKDDGQGKLDVQSEKPGQSADSEESKPKDELPDY